MTPKERAEAAVYFHGYYAAVVTAAMVRNQLDRMVRQLREDKNYAVSDHLHKLANMLDEAVTYPRPQLQRHLFTERAK